ncbi:MAG: glycosyltransferase family 4 protein [Armatimonadetes bacterium]|nr:glycosyltransferase family 4 protein [Armatimonadota bacterium]
MRVAVVGTRGFPGVRGGVERHCEELYPRLARLGVETTVFARKGYTPGTCDFKGVSVRSTWAPNVKGLEAVAHTLCAIPRAAFGDFDLLHVHSIGPASFIPLSRMLGLGRVVLTVHALDYRQGKWGIVGRTYLRAGERVGVRNAKAVITVSSETAEYLRLRYEKPISVIPNGPATLKRRAPGKILEELGLHGGDYLLFVGRLVPDKRVEDLILAARQATPRIRVVIVGDSSHTDDYVKRLKDLSDAQVVFVGYAYGERLEELYCGAAALVLPSSVEGLPMTLLEAMSLGVPVVASDIPGNVEALGCPPAGLLFPVGDVDALASVLTMVLSEKKLGVELGNRALGRIADCYDWDKIAQDTLRVYEAVMAK